MHIKVCTKILFWVIRNQRRRYKDTNNSKELRETKHFAKQSVEISCILQYLGGWVLQIYLDVFSLLFFSVFWVPKVTNLRKLLQYFPFVSGKSPLGTLKWGLRVLGYLSSITHNCLQLSSFCDVTSLYQGPKRPQMCTIADDCAHLWQRVALSPH